LYQKEGLTFPGLQEIRVPPGLTQAFFHSPFSQRGRHVKHGAEYVIEIAVFGCASPAMAGKSWG
jgi:hypothetical protein